MLCPYREPPPPKPTRTLLALARQLAAATGEPSTAVHLLALVARAGFDPNQATRAMLDGIVLANRL